jgi:hypothetical protein
MKQVSCERVGAKKKRKYDEAKTPFLRLLDCSFEDKLEGLNVKHNAMAIKDSCNLVGQKELLDKAIDNLLKIAQDVPMLPNKKEGNGYIFIWLICSSMVRFLLGATRNNV